MQWQLKKTKSILTTVPFAVEELELAHTSTGKGPAHPYHRLKIRDWVNVIPTTADGQVIMVKQTRVGSMTITLETPGGVIDKGETDPAAAALRELEEETGYCSASSQHIGSVWPNPAIQTNQLHVIWAADVYLPDQRQKFPDPDEELEVVAVPLDQACAMARQGEVTNALAALAILMTEPHIRQKLENR